MKLEAIQVAKANMVEIVLMEQDSHGPMLTSQILTT